MRYFTYELIAAANDWVNQSEAESETARAQFDLAVADYHLALDALRGCVSEQAWKFFRHKGLHDATLLRFSVGDDLGDRLMNSPDRRNSLSMAAQFEFMDYESRKRYTLRLHGTRRVRADLFHDQHLFGKPIGDVYTEELTAGNDSNLSLGLLFATGAIIEVEFEKLGFRSRNLLHG